MKNVIFSLALTFIAIFTVGCGNSSDDKSDPVPTVDNNEKEAEKAKEAAKKLEEEAEEFKEHFLEERVSCYQQAHANIPNKEGVDYQSPTLSPEDSIVCGRDFRDLGDPSGQYNLLYAGCWSCKIGAIDSVHDSKSEDYGSTSGVLSILNPSRYGSKEGDKYGDYSVCSLSAKTPPVLTRADASFLGYLNISETMNDSICNAASSNYKPDDCTTLKTYCAQLAKAYY